MPLRRLAYRLAYTVLRTGWWLARPRTQGVKCLLTDGDRVLLVRHTYGPRRWDVPGGGLHRGEDPADTAAREMAEELGLTDVAWRPLADVAAIVDHRRDTLHYFTAELTDPTLTLDLGEIAQARWFARDQLPSPRPEHVDAMIARLGPHGR